MMQLNKNVMTGRTMDHFKAVYRGLDPEEVALRCKLPFNGEAFSLRIMGKLYRAAFPDFNLFSVEFCDHAGRLDHAGRSGPHGNSIEILNPYEKILFIRYLCEGRFVEASGKQLSYREIPWGDLYFANFESRCIRRLAGSFGSKLDIFRKIMEENKGLDTRKIDKADAGYSFDFFNGFFMSFLLWAGDDEFPPSAQILFDDNFPQAFTAEDLAVAADVALERLKAFSIGYEGRDT